MKKLFKVLGIIIIIIVVLYILFIVEECIRLKNENAKPLIILNEDGICEGTNNNGEYKISCKGLGYRVDREYTISDSNDDSDAKTFTPVSGEFWLFDKILLWGWIS